MTVKLFTHNKKTYAVKTTMRMAFYHYLAKNVIFGYSIQYNLFGDAQHHQKYYIF
jgi:hypothetical protein